MIGELLEKCLLKCLGKFGFQRRFHWLSAHQNPSEIIGKISNWTRIFLGLGAGFDQWRFWKMTQKSHFSWGFLVCYRQLARLSLGLSWRSGFFLLESQIEEFKSGKGKKELLGPYTSLVVTLFEYPQERSHFFTTLPLLWGTFIFNLCIWIFAPKILAFFFYKILIRYFEWF